MEEVNAETSGVPLNVPRGMSKRTFLKLAGTALAGAALLGGDTRKEREIELKPSVKVLDFFDVDEAANKYLQDNFPPDFSEEESWKEMGVSDSLTREGLLEAVPTNESQSRLLMIALFKLHYRDHGKNVLSAIEKTASYLNPTQIVAIPEHASIASAVEFGELEYDEMGNPTIHVMLLPKIVDELISQSTESVINMSFELGEFSLTYSLYDRQLKHPDMARQGPSKITVGGKTTYRDYQGNSITEEEYNEISRKMDETEVVMFSPNKRDIKFLDGYAGDKTYQNLLSLTNVARKHPEKIFVAAGGNPTYLRGIKMPDIREARAKLEQQGQWPDNVIIVGFQARESGFVGQASYGADIYVSDKDLKELGFSRASSYATPVITEIVRRLIARGLNVSEYIKKGLMQLAQIAESWKGSEKIEYRLLDLHRAKNSLENLTRSK